MINGIVTFSNNSCTYVSKLCTKYREEVWFSYIASEPKTLHSKLSLYCGCLHRNATQSTLKKCTTVQRFWQSDDIIQRSQNTSTRMSTHARTTTQPTKIQRSLTCNGEDVRCEPHCTQIGYKHYKR